MMWETLCEQWHMGALLEPPRQLSGGLLHRMFGVRSSQAGEFAVKLLNPEVMARADALENFRLAEALEAKLEQAGLPILPALERDGRKLWQLDGQYFYVFAWYPGRALSAQEVRPAHCRRMGEVLARIHAVERRDEPLEEAAFHADWAGHVRALASAQPELSGRLKAALPLLEELERRAAEALPRLPRGLAICHHDMDRKNVLWAGEDYRVIDLECLSYGSPARELLETALCWSGFDRCALDAACLAAFTEGYAAGGVLPADWAPLYDGNTGRLEWLAYNLGRARSEDPAERAVGLAQSGETLTQLSYTHRERERILSLLP